MSVAKPTTAAAAAATTITATTATTATLARLVSDAYHRINAARKNGARKAKADYSVCGPELAPCVACGAAGASLHMGLRINESTKDVVSVEHVWALIDDAYIGQICDYDCWVKVNSALMAAVSSTPTTAAAEGDPLPLPHKKRRRGHGKSTTASATRGCPTAAVRGGYAILKRNRRQRRLAATEHATAAATAPRHRSR